VGFEAFLEKMTAAGLPELAIRVFERQYAQLEAGESGLVRESEIEPVDALPDLDAMPDELEGIGRAALDRCVMIKLNGGLGTSMGLERAKSLLTVKDDLRFLDVIARHALRSGVRLVLMNSFSTEADTRAALEGYEGLGDGPLDFLQHRVPKVSVADLAPVEWPENPALEWNPPGHGDLYTALQTSGMLAALLAEGRDLAFVSNADNLGAAIDLRLLGYLAAEPVPLLMEVADRTAADRKGGHLARFPQGGLLLREAAQCPPEDERTFQDIRRHRFFNTNNVWLDLRALEQALASRQGILELPLIRNEKLVDPRTPGSPQVFQLETAMGSAIELLDGAAAMRVPRSRFAPVKTTDDLRAVRSDAYVLTDDFRVVPDPARAGRPVIVELDRRFFAYADQLDARFPTGPPSLARCERLVVEGDVVFGADVSVVGEARVINAGGEQLRIGDGTMLGTSVAPQVGAEGDRSSA
jgi:UTP--glucose-1-phosphate uridylyltransferase